MREGEKVWVFVIVVFFFKKKKTDLKEKEKRREFIESVLCHVYLRSFSY